MLCWVALLCIVSNSHAQDLWAAYDIIELTDVLVHSRHKATSSHHADSYVIIVPYDSIHRVPKPFKSYLRQRSGTQNSSYVVIANHYHNGICKRSRVLEWYRISTVLFVATVHRRQMPYLVKDKSFMSNISPLFVNQSNVWAKIIFCFEMNIRIYLLCSYSFLIFIHDIWCHGIFWYLRNPSPYIHIAFSLLIYNMT